jgi:hypothetical protein
MFSVSKKKKENNICICIETLCYIAYRDRFIASENVSNKKQNFLILFLCQIKNRYVFVSVTSWK